MYIKNVPLLVYKNPLGFQSSSMPVHIAHNIVGKCFCSKSFREENISFFDITSHTHTQSQYFDTFVFYNINLST